MSTRRQLNSEVRVLVKTFVDECPEYPQDINGFVGWCMGMDAQECEAIEVYDLEPVTQPYDHVAEDLAEAEAFWDVWEGNSLRYDSLVPRVW